MDAELPNTPTSVELPIYESIKASGYFDESRYVREHGEEIGDLDPLLYYIRTGWTKHHKPSDKFDDDRYRNFYLDLRFLPFPGLYHFVNWGAKEGRHPFPETDKFKAWYPEEFDADAFFARRHKLLLAVHQLDMTGVPVLSLNIAKLFAKDRGAAMITPLDGPLRAQCLAAGIPVFVDPSFYFDAERCGMYRRLGFECCIFNTICVSRAFLLVRNELASILWVHDNVTKEFLPKDMHEPMEQASGVYATSCITSAMVKTYAPGVRYLPYPVEDVRCAPKQPVRGKLRFGIIGRYEPRKGQDIAAQAFMSLPKAIKDKCSLIMVGSVAQQDYYANLVAQCAGEDIDLRGVVADPVAYQALYDEMDVLLCPSRNDPMPLVVIDAMMHGCPVVITDEVGQKEFIRNGENGYVFKNEDVYGLAAIMKDIVSNCDNFLDMSKAARETFLKNFEMSFAKASIAKALDEAITDLETKGKKSL